MRIIISSLLPLLFFNNDNNVYVEGTVVGGMMAQKRTSEYPIPKSEQGPGDINGNADDSTFHGCRPVGLLWKKGSYPFLATRLDPQYTLCTDAWGGFAAAPGSYEQVQCLSYLAGFLAWKVHFDISSASSRQDNQVKSYPNVVWSKSQGSVQIKQLSRFYTEWDWFLFKESPRIVSDVSYDIFLTRSPYCRDIICASQEIMIWLGVTGAANPLGTKRGRVRINNSDFDVWQGFGFVPVVTLIPTDRNQAHHAFSANLLPLIQRSLGPFGVSQDQFILSVGAGIEIFEGKGALITKRYKLDIN